MTIRLKDNGIEPVSFVASWESIEKTKDGQLAFANKRAEVWWKFREALDPDQPDGSAIALPPDPELRADLCAPMETRRSGHSARKQRRKQRFWKPQATTRTLAGKRRCGCYVLVGRQRIGSPTSVAGRVHGSRRRTRSEASYSSLWYGLRTGIHFASICYGCSGELFS